MVSTSNQQTKTKEEILYLSFNQDQGCFSAGTQTGFRVYNTKPFKDQFVRSKLPRKFMYRDRLPGRDWHRRNVVQVQYPGTGRRRYLPQVPTEQGHAVGRPPVESYWRIVFQNESYGCQTKKGQVSSHFI